MDRGDLDIALVLDDDATKIDMIQNKHNYKIQKKSLIILHPVFRLSKSRDSREDDSSARLGTRIYRHMSQEYR
jgi:hypothetical protein